MRKIIYLLPLLLSLSGCQFLKLTPDAYQKSDRATYDAIAPEYAAYVVNDQALDQEQKDRRARELETWRKRVNAPAEAPTPLPVP